MDEEEKSEVQTNGDGDRQVLAPSEGPREELISTAIKFLQNPKVMESPLSQKKAFLTKKGLTQDEINLAVDRAGVKEVVHTSTNGNQPMDQTRLPPPGYQSGMLAPVPYGPVYPPVPPQSRWAQFRDLTLTSVVIAGVSYALYHFFKTYLAPLIYGTSKAQEKRIACLESEIQQIHQSVKESLSDISKTLAAIQIGINSQNQQPNPTVGRGITDLKADISSLRSLLLSKNQFPAPPTTAPILPSWQLAGPSSVTTQPESNPGSPQTSQSTSRVQQSAQSLSDEAMPASAGEKEGEEDESVDSSHTPVPNSNHVAFNQEANDEENEPIQDKYENPRISPNGVSQTQSS